MVSKINSDIYNMVVSAGIVPNTDLKDLSIYKNLQTLTQHELSHSQLSTYF